MTGRNPFSKFSFSGRRKPEHDGTAAQSELPYEVVDDASDATEEYNNSELAPNLSAPPPPPLAALKMVTRRRTTRDEDDDDDLLTLGGSAAVSKQTSPVARTVPSPPRPSVRTATSLTRPLASLDWQCKRSADRRTIVDMFRQQFAFELNNDDELRAAFYPFSRDRTLTKLLSSAPAQRVLERPPVLTMESLDSLEGCVLRPYQVEGVQFLLNGFNRGMNLILSDDMGLGKTAQVASFLSVLRKLYGIKGPHLLVVPLTTISSWMRELCRWAPHLHVVKYHGEEKVRTAIQLDRHNNRHAVFITTSGTFKSDKRFLQQRCWVAVVVDEAHILKGETSINHQVKKLDACIRIAVTGTPVHNRAKELWNLLGFLYPYLGVEFTEPDDECDVSTMQSAKLLQKIMLRRTKDTLDLGIPPRTDHPTIFVPPTRLQQALFDFIAAAALSDDVESNAMFSFFTRQRHICNHPLTLKLLLGLNRTAGAARGACVRWEGARGRMEDNSPAIARLKHCNIAIDERHLVEPSTKMRKLDEMLTRLKADGHRVLIFSNFTSSLDFIEGLCVMRGYPYERLDGSCTAVERELSIVRFNNPLAQTFAFLVTTTAGGVGVTLTGADTVILFDAHYNPQIDRQAADRAHRIGQTRPVTVYRLCVKDSMEEKIQAIARRKAELGDRIVEGGMGQSVKSGGGVGGGAGSGVTADEIRAMFRAQGKASMLAQQQHHSAALLASTLGEAERAEMVRYYSQPDVVDVDEEEEETTKDVDDRTPVLKKARSEEPRGRPATTTVSVAHNPPPNTNDGCQEDDVDLTPKLQGVPNHNKKPAVTMANPHCKGAHEFDMELFENLVKIADGDWSDESSCFSSKQPSGRETYAQTHVCFDCGERMKPLEPLLHCNGCTKAFHADCVDGYTAGARKPSQWYCPRHSCVECGKAQAAEQAIFACYLCPVSYCFDCLDPRYLTLDDDGIHMKSISHMYPGMEEEGMPRRKSFYYLTCLHCAGMLTPDESDNDSNESSSSAS